MKRISELFQKYMAGQEQIERWLINIGGQDNAINGVLPSNGAIEERGGDVIYTALFSKMESLDEIEEIEDRVRPIKEMLVSVLQSRPHTNFLAQANGLTYKLWLKRQKINGKDEYSVGYEKIAI